MPGNSDSETAEPTQVTGALPTTQSPEWGPLAVIKAPPADSGLSVPAPRGVLQISQDCVTFRGATLVWRGSQTTWEDDAQEILFQDVHDGNLALADGQEIGVNSFEPLALLDTAEWLSLPAESCPDELLIVDFIEP